MSISRRCTTSLSETIPVGNLNTAMIHLSCKVKEHVFSQGDRSDSAFFIERGRVKLTVLSRWGREAIIGFSGPNDFFGEQALAGETSRAMSVTVVEDCSLLKIGRSQMQQILRLNSPLSAAFISYLLQRNLRLHEDLVDHFFNQSEKRLARVLLSMACCGSESRLVTSPTRINQETLAEMVGTTRGRICFFMNKFRDEGLIQYHRNGGLCVCVARLNDFLASESM